MLIATYSYGNDQSYANYSGNGTQGYHSPAYAGAATKWFQDYAVHFETQGANIKPYVVLDATTWQGRELLNKVHTSVVGVHDRAGIEIPAPFKATPPTQVVVTVWDQAVTNVGGAWSHYKKGNQESAPNRVPGAAMAPFTGEALYLANEAWSTISGWAEGSLIMAENVIMKFFGVPKPTYVSPERHDCVMFETYFYNATLCRSSLNPLQSTV